MKVNLAFSERDYFAVFKRQALSTFRDLFRSTRLEKAYVDFAHRVLGAENVKVTIDDGGWFSLYSNFSLISRIVYPPKDDLYLILSIDVNFKNTHVSHPFRISPLTGKVISKSHRFSLEFAYKMYDFLSLEQKAEVSEAAKESRERFSTFTIWIWPDISSWDGWEVFREEYAAIPEIWNALDRDIDTHRSVNLTASQLASMANLLRSALFRHKESEGDSDPDFKKWFQTWFGLSYLVYLEKDRPGFSFWVSREFYDAWKVIRSGKLPPYRPLDVISELPYGPVGVQLTLHPVRPGDRRIVEKYRPFVLKLGGGLWYPYVISFRYVDLLVYQQER